jgi:hypothetical protein
MAPALGHGFALALAAFIDLVVFLLEADIIRMRLAGDSGDSLIPNLRCGHVLRSQNSPN